MSLIFTARKRSLGQGYIFTPVCHSVHRGGGMCGCSRGGCAWLLPGGMHGCLWGHAWLLWGVCMVALGGMHGFIQGGMCGFIRGACMVLFGGMCGFIWGACVVLFGGACMVLFGGACVVLFRGGMHGFFSFFGYNEIRSMSGRYASYWNAFLSYCRFTESVDLSYTERITPLNTYARVLLVYPNPRIQVKFTLYKLTYFISFLFHVIHV